MNTFNCFQAIAFYTLLPFVLMWLHQAGYQVFMWIGIAIQIISYIALSMFMADKTDK